MLRPTLQNDFTLNPMKNAVLSIANNCSLYYKGYKLPEEIRKFYGKYAL